MGVRLQLDCGGCDASVLTQGHLSKQFHSLDGSGHGFGRWILENPEDLAPEGWIMFDPYTQQTYCPECWGSIVGDGEETR